MDESRRVSGLEGSLTTLEKQLGPAEAEVGSVDMQQQQWHEAWQGRKVGPRAEGNRECARFLNLKLVLN